MDFVLDMEVHGSKVHINLQFKESDFYISTENLSITQLTFTCCESTGETLGKGVKLTSFYWFYCQF